MAMARPRWKCDKPPRALVEQNKVRIKVVKTILSVRTATYDVNKNITH